MRKGLMGHKPVYYTTDNGTQVKTYFGKLQGVAELEYIDSGLPPIFLKCNETTPKSLSGLSLNIINNAKYKITYRAYWLYDTNNGNHSYHERCIYAVAKNNKIKAQENDICLSIEYVSSSINIHVSMQTWDAVTILKVESYNEPTELTTVKLTTPNKIIKPLSGNIFNLEESSKYFIEDSTNYSSNIYYLKNNYWVITPFYGIRRDKKFYYTTEKNVNNLQTIELPSLVNYVGSTTLTPRNLRGFLKIGYYESNDGITWSYNSSSYENVIYVGNRYFCLSSNTISTLSGNNILNIGDLANNTYTWTNTNLPTDANIHTIKYANGIYVAMGNTESSQDLNLGTTYSGGGIYYSTDGITWTKALSQTIGSLFYVQGVWYATTYYETHSSGSTGTAYYTDWYYTLYYSTNGKTWTKTSNSYFKDNTGGLDAIKFYYNKFWLCWGHTLYTSSDGINWTICEDPSYGTNILCIDGLLIITHTGSSFYYSTDGTTWTIYWLETASDGDVSFKEDSSTIIEENGLICITDIGVNSTGTYEYDRLFCTTKNQLIPNYLEVK